jgi:predicted helicase
LPSERSSTAFHLHHPEYRSRYAANLKRELPRIPFASDFHSFAAAGRSLAHLHLDYESLDPYPLQENRRPRRPLLRVHH